MGQIKRSFGRSPFAFLFRVIPCNSVANFVLLLSIFFGSEAKLRIDFDSQDYAAYKVFLWGAIAISRCGLLKLSDVMRSIFNPKRLRKSFKRSK